MEIKVTGDDGKIIRLAINGKVRQDKLTRAGDPLAQVLGEPGYSRKVVVDMSKADYVDSSGISWLLVCHKRCREAKGAFVMHSLAPLVLNVLKVVKLDTIFDIADSEPQALGKALTAGSEPPAPPKKPEYPKHAEPTEDAPAAEAE